MKHHAVQTSTDVQAATSVQTAVDVRTATGGARYEIDRSVARNSVCSQC